MKLPTVKELVENNKRVYFQFYQDGTLWYKTESGFEFPVPCSDTGTGIFKVEDKALLFMRWIRKHIKYLEDSLKQENAQ